MSNRGYGGFGSGYGAPYLPTGRYSSPGYYNQALARQDWVPDWANMDGGVDWPPQGQGIVMGPAVNAFVDGSGVVPFLNPEPVVNDGALSTAMAGVFGAADGLLEGASEKTGLPKILVGVIAVGLAIAVLSGGSHTSYRSNPRRKKHKPWSGAYGTRKGARFTNAGYRARHNRRR